MSGLERTCIFYLRHNCELLAMRHAFQLMRKKFDGSTIIFQVFVQCWYGETHPISVLFNWFYKSNAFIHKGTSTKFPVVRKTRTMARKARADEEYHQHQQRPEPRESCTAACAQELPGSDRRLTLAQRQGMEPVRHLALFS